MNNTFVIAKADINEVVRWLYRHDPDRTNTSYVYGSFHIKGADIRKDPSFRGIRVHITSDDLVVMFKLVFGEKIKEDCVRAGDSYGYMGFKF